MPSEAEFLRHEACPKCNSRDNLARYTDGHAFCFGCSHYENGAGTESTSPRKDHAPRTDKPMLDGEPIDLPKRGLLKVSCEKWRYHSGSDEAGRKVQLANYCDMTGRPVAQKVRYADKTFSWRGDKQAAGLFGQQLWRDAGRMLVVTEGEIDALSVSQVQSHKWPVVSVPDGAQGAARAFRKSIDFLSKWEKVVLLFDSDEAGRSAAEECAALLRPGQAFVGALPLKDANDMLKAERGAEIITAIWEAKPFRPDGIINATRLVEKALRPIETGLPWFLPELTKATYGRRPGEVYTIGAGTGVGKTDFLMQQLRHDVFVLNKKVGVLFLEQQPEESLRRLMGKQCGKRFHIPDGSWTQAELADAFAANASALQNLDLYDHFGAIDWETIEARLRYLVVGCGCKIIYLDHLTALAAGQDDERKALENIMAELAGFCQETGCILILVSHLNTPEGKAHEEGGRVMIRHFKGSRAIGYWSHFMFGMERNTQADAADERTRTVFRCLKDRYTGNATGNTFALDYDNTTGLLSQGGSVTFSAEMEF